MSSAKVCESSSLLFPRSLRHTTPVSLDGRQCFSGCSTSDVRFCRGSRLARGTETQRPPPGGAVETHSAGLAVGYLPSCRAHLGVVTYLLALRSSRRLWPAPTTAPLAAFPPMAPIAAPLAAPLALGWVVSFGGGCVFGGVCVAAGGVCAGGGVCASAAGATAPESAIRRDITLAECFMMASLGRPPVYRCSRSAACARRGHHPYSRLLFMMLCSVAQMFFAPISHAARQG